MTHDLATLRQLAERVAKATTADREIDCVVAVIGCKAYDVFNSAELAIHDSWPIEQQYVYHYTASLDACVALAERVLPGCNWRILGGSEGGYAYIANPIIETISGWGRAKTPALAFLSAILAALIAVAQS